MSDQSIIDFVLSRSRNARGVVPILVPTGLLLLPRDTISGLDEIRDQLLAEVRRRTTYLRGATGAKIVGLAVAWIGVAVPHGRPVTVGGICLTLAGSLLDLTRGDRLHAIESSIGNLWEKYHIGLLEFATIRLAISPYSYAETGASGISSCDILESRKHLIGDDVVTALVPYTKPLTTTLTQQEFGRVEWLSTQINELEKIDRSARRRAIGTGRKSDMIYAALLAINLLVAIMSATSVVPEASLATAALIIVLISRPGHLTLGALVTASHGEPIAEWIARYGRMLKETGASEENLSSLLTAEVAIARSIRFGASRSTTAASD